MFIYGIPCELVVLQSYKPPLLEELQGRESMFIYGIPYELVVLRSCKPPLQEVLQGRGRKHVYILYTL